MFSHSVLPTVLQLLLLQGHPTGFSSCTGSEHNTEKQQRSNSGLFLLDA